MSLTPGTTLGPYSVTAKIGEGGMGEVYQARDTKLDRDVALKVLPEAFTSDPDRLARFEREAKVLASLNHPNIGSIYGLEEAEGVKALVLELVEGPTLADRISNGSIPLDEALPIAKQIAEALEAAHEAGVIHRDLKPANIKVRDDGTVKVLDFGLAKAFQPDASDPNMSASPTISLTAAATQMGMVIGTAAYMAPEQAKGLTVDKRADVWAFGAVLYEMLTGTKPFVGDDVSDTLALVLKFEPEWDALPADTPARLRQLVRTCLQKSPKQRVHDVADVRLAMEGVFETTVSAPSETATAPPLQVWQRPLPATLTALGLVALTGLGAWSVMRPADPPAESVRRFALDIGTASLMPISNVHAMPAWSPDGTRLVYAANVTGTTQLYVRDLDDLDARPIAGTENAWEPFFSPDGEWVGFFDPFIRELRRVSVRGGTPLTLCGCFPPGGATWLPDGTIVFAHEPAGGTGTTLSRIPETGGTPEPLTTLDAEFGETGHFWPRALPGGTDVLFTIFGGPDTDTARVAVLSLETGEQHVVVESGFNARYVSTGHLVFARQGALWGVPFDLDLLAPTGPEEVLVQGIEANELFGLLALAVSSDGSLVYVSAGAAGSVGEMRTLVWVDREGREEPIAMPPRPYFSARLSPDGTRVAVEVRGENTDIWVHDLARGTQTRLTFDPGQDRFPVWTPDGERIAFSSDREGGILDIFWKLAVGTGQVEPVVSDSNRVLHSWSWTPDGQSLLINEGGLDIGIVTLDGDRTRQPVLEDAFNEGTPEVSPNGRWMAYRSNESGRFEVFVRPFPGVDGGKWPVSTEGGNYPVWSSDGRELFYRTLDGAAVMGVEVETEPTFSAGIPEVRVQGDYVYSLGDGRNWDISPDGQRFLMLKNVGQRGTEDTPPPTLTVVLNWHEELKRLVPVP